MKKILSVVLVVLMLVSVMAFVGCEGEKAETLKFGMGVYSYYGDVTDADADTNGSGEVVVTVAAVLLDGEGRIVKADFDTADNTVKYTSDGKAVAAGEFKTKKELGSSYGMVAYGGAVKEWFEQVDALESVIAGKTLDEVKAMVVNGYKGNDDIINAGCTIGISDFVYALEKAVANAKDSAATAEETLNIGIVTVQKNSDATEEKNGAAELVVTAVAAAVGKDGKVAVACSETLAVNFSFDMAGASTLDTSAALKTKDELGTAYNMSAYGSDLNGDGIVKEWNEQADIFDAACAGLDAAGIAALAVNGYGVESLQTAGCTVGITDLVKAAVKAATIG